MAGRRVLFDGAESSVGWIAGCGLLGAAVGASGQVELAEDFIVPDFRGGTDTSFNGWGALLGRGNLDPVGWSGRQRGQLARQRRQSGFLRQTNPAAGAFITEGGGSTASAGFWSSRSPTPPASRLEWSRFQASTSGTWPDYDSVSLRYEEGGETVYLSPYPVAPGQNRIDLVNREEAFMGGTSYLRESLWQVLGEAEAFHLGDSVQSMKRMLVLLCACGVGAAVSVAGMIGFVGLVVPHLVRITLGPDH